MTGPANLYYIAGFSFISRILTLRYYMMFIEIGCSVAYSTFTPHLYHDASRKSYNIIDSARISVLFKAYLINAGVIKQRLLTIEALLPFGFDRADQFEPPLKRPQNIINHLSSLLKPSGAMAVWQFLFYFIYYLKYIFFCIAIFIKMI